MRSLALILITLAMAAQGWAQRTVSFRTEDGATIVADLYGTGDRGVVLAHGGRFTRKSWEPQAKTLADAGFRVLAIDFRGFGESHGPGEKDFYTAPFQLDVLAAVRYLRANGAKHISVIGGSFGGAAAGDASIASNPGEIERVVMLGAAPNGPADKLQSATLFIVAREDTSGDGPRLPGILSQYQKAPQPKQLIVLEGSAHAQFLFATDLGSRVMRELLEFLNGKRPE
jgi:pimeloyl-ACP methyl ester carboxylesterase